MNTFEVGQRVVCLFWHCRAHRENPELECPRFGHVYTVRQLSTGHMGTLSGPEVVNLRLKEIVNPPTYWADGFQELAFPAHGFKPLAENETASEFFERLLAPTSKPLIEVE